MSVIVVKIGGAEGVSIASACADIAALVRAGTQVVVVHGGSDATNTLSRRLGHEPKFITSPSGHVSRRTDAATLEIFQMACRGSVNPGIVAALLGHGIEAVGISGVDGRLWLGERKAAVRAVEEGRTVVIRDDFTGSVETVNVRLLRTLLDAGFTPVISPPAITAAGEVINIDADRAAAKTAAALGAESLVLLTNVRGLLRSFPDESTLISRLTRAELEGAEAMAGGRMKKKVMGVREAIDGGVRRAVISDARVERPVSAALAGAGTMVE